MAIEYRQSISTKLTLMNMLVSGVALLLACAGFFAYDQITFRQGLVRTLSAQAQIIASNSVSALLFNDPQSASKTLSALSSSPNIASAGVLGIDRRPFAGRTPDTDVTPALFGESHTSSLYSRLVGAFPKPWPSSRT